MTDRSLLALVARKVPVIWDAVGPASLNPQPLPPLERPPVWVDPLNPQPLPPGPPPELYGVAVAHELLRLQWQADGLGLTLPAGAAWLDDAAPAPPAAPSLPPWLPQVTEPNAAWLEGYHLGLACALAVARPTSAPERSADLVDGVLDRAVDALARLGGAAAAAWWAGLRTGPARAAAARRAPRRVRGPGAPARPRPGAAAPG